MTRRSATSAARHEHQAVVVGGSAGAIAALAHILPPLPPDYSMPVVIVVHLPADGRGGMAELFQRDCGMRVKEAEDKEPLAAGTVYFAPPDYHVLVEKTGRLSLSCEEPVRYARPSIDVLFQSAADAYGAALVAVILSGANEDGADGLRSVCGRGGIGLVQDPESAEMPTMPQAALRACEAARSLTVKEITEYLRAIGGGGHVTQSD